MHTRTQNGAARRRSRASRLAAACIVIIAMVAGSGAAPAMGSARGDKLLRKANKISRQLTRRHLPHGTVFDPQFASPESDEIVGYIHAADAAIWTGHFIAAEAHNFAVTRAPRARKNVRKALEAIRLLVLVSGNDVLARAAVPVGSRWESAILSNNPDHIYYSTVEGVDYVWVGNTSRDQYSGVFFGLGFVWEFMRDDPVIRGLVVDIADRLLGYLINNAWTVEMPDGALSTTFIQRPDQQLAFLQTGRQIKPERFDSAYRSVRSAYGKLVKLPISAEATDPHGSYFKFNLDHINLVHLLRHEEPGEFLPFYQDAWETLRGVTREHGNPHFDMLARVVEGPDPDRDRAIKRMLKDWLKRPRRIGYEDRSDEYAACGDNQACDALPTLARPPTDFLWQRSPFLLSGGLGGDVEGSGIDYLLPFWMARYFGIA